MLSKFRAAKAAEIAELRALDKAGILPEPYEGPRPGFAQALKAKGPGAVIAEYKRASPSKGEINLELSPDKAAGLFAQSGAAAISVLTETQYFRGSLDFLPLFAKSGLPLLRKDFILDPLQIAQTAATCASALLLIVRMLEPGELSELLDLADSFGLECVVEVFDQADLETAQAAHAGIIQVNNRDLNKLTTDLGISHRLCVKKRPGEVWISASGIFERAEVLEMAGLGFDGVLIGTSVMLSSDPGAALKSLTGVDKS